MKFEKAKKIILLISLIALISILIILIICLLSNKKTEKYIATPVTLKFESRVEKLNTFNSNQYYKFGWLQVQGTNIDLPILDYNSSDNYDEIDYSYGWVSSYYNDSENRAVLMGHNILNVSNEPMLPNENLTNFEEIMAFTYEGFAKDNLYIQYTRDGKDEIYLIYAAGFYDYFYDRAETINDKEKLDKYIKKVKDNSIYDYDVDVNSDDEIITVKTCTRYFGIDEKQQFQLDARKLRDGEDIVKYQVKANKNFKKLNLNEEKM